MLHFRRPVLVMFSGMIWMVIGCGLLSQGLNLLIDGAKGALVEGQAAYPLLKLCASLAGGEHGAALLLVSVGLALGYVKGRYVLFKSCKRVVARISELPEPASLFKMWSPAFYFLIGFMMLLGMGMKVSGVPSDLRGVIDVAVGSALINGAMVYFRFASQMRLHKGNPSEATQS